ncbi:phage tail length tape measure family protein [Escherichia coli]|uniref:phage tail length tape measure family protein n=1 Tax=Escherichia coli TaxID=562 RepID=UPI003D80A569
MSDFNKTLVLSGNQSGLTADRMLVLSRAGQAAGLTFNQTSESLSAPVATASEVAPTIGRVIAPASPLNMGIIPPKESLT